MPAKRSGKRAVKRTRRAASTRKTAKPRKRAAQPRTEWQLDDQTIESALRTGDSADLLQDYFGPENYRELKQLSRDAAARGVRGGPRVLILPGIMGSQIGKPGLLGIPDIYWFDPLDIADGQLTSLAVDGGVDRFKAVGVMLLYYLKLKLRLCAAGYDAHFHAFDWRKSIAALGKELADRLSDEGRNTALVAHSMGGLVARWALGEGNAKCSKLIMLGTPNFGSWAPVMAMRAAYPIVRKVGAIDLHNSPEDLARKVFSTFPGLTQMFPAKEKQGAFDVYDLDNWPAGPLRPRANLLKAVDAVRAGMIDKGNIYMIAGVDQETPVGVDPVYGNGEGKPPTEFSYKFSHDGDGTVPLDLALLPGAQETYYVAEQHGSLPNNKIVAKAVLDLLDRNETHALPTTRFASSGSRAVRTKSEDELQTDPYEGRRGRALSASELRHVLDEFASTEARDNVTMLPAEGVSKSVTLGGGAVQPEGYNHTFDSVVVGRRRQHRIDLRFAFGSITEVDTRAIALGIFRDVTPGGAAAAVDKRLNGAVTDMTERRMFAGSVGEIFVLPTGRHAVAADIITFVGLGEFDRFQDEVLQTAAENLIRTFIRSRIEEFATVVFGGGSGESIAAGLRNMLGGFVRGLIDADTDHQFRRIIVCEQDRNRYDQLKQELFRLSSTSLCQDIELTFDEIALPAAPEAAALTGSRAISRKTPVYLTVREEPNGSKNTPNVRTSLLTTGDKATVVTGIRSVNLTELNKLRDRAADDGTTSFDGIGDKIAKLLLADEVQMVLPRFQKHPLVIVHDAESSRAPWETIALPTEKGELWYPAQNEGVSHRFAADKLSVAKWLDERVNDGVLNVLLIVDPSGNLPGAREEGERVMKLLSKQPNCKIDRLQFKEATRPALLAAFGSGKYDVVHYAGHAGFDAHDSAQSGLLCYNDVYLTGADLSGVSRLPTLVFFNACESARVRRLRASGKKALAKKQSHTERIKHIPQTVSVAEALMRGGIANFLGTYWPVNDAAAETFASTFYPALLRGDAIGDAIQKARRALVDDGNKDWANYIFYGNQDFVLKEVMV